MRDQIAVLVSSCDKYADLWSPFFSLIRYYWPDCPFDIYLMSNNLHPDIQGVTTLAVGEDVSWSDNMIKSLAMIDKEYVLLILDDLLLSKPVVTSDLLEILGWMTGIKANYLRLYPKPGPDRILNSKVGGVAPGALYRTSTVVSAWKREVLRDLLKPGEDAWDFERNGSRRSDKYNGFYSARHSYFHVINSTIRSRLCREALLHLRRHGIEPDWSSRETMTATQELGYFLRRQRGRLFRLLPNTQRRRIKSFFLGEGS